jgi:hypothetical protein
MLLSIFHLLHQCPVHLTLDCRCRQTMVNPECRAKDASHRLNQPLGAGTDALGVWGEGPPPDCRRVLLGGQLLLQGQQRGGCGQLLAVLLCRSLRCPVPSHTSAFRNMKVSPHAPSLPFVSSSFTGTTLTKSGVFGPKGMQPVRLRGASQAGAMGPTYMVEPPVAVSKWTIACQRLFPKR